MAGSSDYWVTDPDAASPSEPMIRPYLDVCAALALPELASRFIAGDLETAWTGAVTHRKYPPALIPLFQRNDALYGYWQHWFVPGRRRTLVELDAPDHVARHLSVVEMFVAGPDPRRRYELIATEIACSMDQLVRITLLDWLCNGAMDWTPDLYRFAATTGIGDDDLGFIDAVAVREYRPVAFLTHPLFQDRTPVACHRDDTTGYRGDFPYPKADLSAEVLRGVAAYELHSRYMYEPAGSTAVDLRDAVAARVDAPPWLRLPTVSPENDLPSRVDVFDTLLERGDLGGAWLCLNGPGWRCADAVAGLWRLAGAAADPDFNRLVAAYAALDHDRSDWY